MAFFPLKAVLAVTSDFKSAFKEKSYTTRKITFTVIINYPLSNNTIRLYLCPMHCTLDASSTKGTKRTLHRGTFNSCLSGSVRSSYISVLEVHIEASLEAVSAISCFTSWLDVNTTLRTVNAAGCMSLLSLISLLAISISWVILSHASHCKMFTVFLSLKS